MARIIQAVGGIREGSRIVAFAVKEEEMEEGEGRDPLRNAGVYLTYSSLPLTVRLPRWTETAQRLSSTGGVPDGNKGTQLFIPFGEGHEDGITRKQ